MVSLITLLISLILFFTNTVLDLGLDVFLVPFFMIIMTCAIAYDIRRSRALRPFLAPLMLGYFWRISLLLLDIYGKSIYNLPNSGADTEGFYRNAVLYSQNQNIGDIGMFPTVMGSIMKITGTSRLLAQYFVLLFSIVALCFFARILYESKISDVVKSRTMYIVAVLPNFAILSVIFLRESIVAMFLTISIYCIDKWIREKKEIYYVLAFVAVFIGAMFHSGCVGVAVGYVAIRFIYDNKLSAMKINIRTTTIAVLFFIVVVFLWMNYGSTFFSKMMGVEEISDIGNTSSLGGSSYAQFVGNSDNLLSMIIYTIPRMVYFLFSPFPWQWRGASDIIAFVFSSLFYWFTIVDVIKYLSRYKGENKNEVVILTIIAACVVFVFGWGVSNAGTAARHREKIFLLFGTLYALTHPENKGIKLKFGGKRIM